MGVAGDPVGLSRPMMNLFIGDRRVWGIPLAQRVVHHWWGLNFVATTESLDLVTRIGEIS